MVLTKILVFIILVAVAFLILKYTEPIVRMIGKSDLAERYLGMGGTYNMWKIIAVILIIAGLLYVTGTISFGLPALQK